MRIIKTHRYWRLFEMIPGLISWTALALPVIFSIVEPKFVAYFIISYTLLWLFRSVLLSINLSKSFSLTKQALSINWQKKLEENDWENLYGTSKKNNLGEGLYQAILFVTYKESLEVVEASIKSYVSSAFPSKKIIFVFAGEERDRENFLNMSLLLKKKYEHLFARFLVTLHPGGLPGEIMGKSANSRYAAQKLKEYVDQQGITYKNVIVSNFDADTVVHPQYFSELSYKYLHTKNNLKKTYQPTHMYHNNIWDVPSMMRLVSLSCTYLRMAESMNKRKFKSFSSRSIGLQTLIDIDYWDPGIIPEDSRQYWTAFFLSDGDHELVPIYTPVYMDAVLDKDYFSTFKSQYTQLRRWAWGVCDFAFVMANSLNNTKIPRWKKIIDILTLLENHFCWATAPILITFSGWLPGLLNSQFRTTVLAYTTPSLTSKVLTLAGIGILTCIIVSFSLIPPRPHGKKWVQTVILMAQWTLTPVVSIFLSAIPALDAQTRLLFGRYLEYQVTPKSRREKFKNR
ncbi:hypothetical protein HYV57_01680 [Candidatus Peregrinibacteria bacterium]|nr:hypothetical protein [Candidatus Peregrinibacteria bacterium]